MPTLCYTWSMARTRKITAEPRSLPSSEPSRRINITMLESQHDALVARGLNVSGLIRDLVDQYLSQSVITLQVDEETRKLYDHVVSRTGANDEEIASRLRDVLRSVLAARVAELTALQRELSKEE